MKQLLLIHPPVAKPCEPPPGIARLAGALRAQGLRCRALDASLEGLLWLLQTPSPASDTWTHRAVRHRENHLTALRQGAAFHNPDRYRRAVRDLERILQTTDAAGTVRVGLANYQDRRLSPVRSADLIRAAEIPEANPFFPYFAHRLAALLETDGAGVIGFSLNYLSQALCTFAMIGYLRRVCPEVHIVAGGGLVTTWLRSPRWSDPFRGLVDDWVAGPGEDPLLALLGKPPTDCTPTPDYIDFSFSGYLSPGFVLPYSASSGCYWSRCSFCPERAEGNAYRPVPPARVVSDLRRLVHDTRPVLIHLLDNALSPKLLRALAVNPPGVPWYGFARITPHLADSDFCRALRQSGCVMLKLGLESGDQGVLDALGKGIDLATASRVLHTLWQSGIAAYVYLLFGTAAENQEQARRTLAFTVRHAPQIAFLNLAIFNLPAFGPDADQLRTQSFYEGDLSLYRQFAHPSGWHRDRVRHFLDREFKRHPAIAEILRRDPPVFTSNHAPFFLARS